MSRDRPHRQPIADIPAPEDIDGEYFVWYFYDSMSGPLKTIEVTSGFLQPEETESADHVACRWESFTSGEEAFQRASKLYHLFESQLESGHPELPGVMNACDRCG